MTQSSRTSASRWVAPALALLVAVPSCKGEVTMHDEPPPPPTAHVDSLPARLEPLVEPPSGRVDTPAPMPTVEVRVGGSSIELWCVLANAGDEPLALALKSASYSSSPLDAGIVSSPRVKPVRRGESGPSVRAEYYRLTIPPRSSVRLAHTISLRDYEYSGAPKAEVYWHLAYANYTDRTGQVTVELPWRL